MVDEHRALGLDVTVSGDTSALDRLDQRALSAIVRAVAQCLANVRKHAGTDAAEVSVFDDSASCTVMVVDDGRGLTKTPPAPTGWGSAGRSATASDGSGVTSRSGRRRVPGRA
ncbi:hypothetical protein Q9Q99_06510 [Curtobacterium flaccumfaciens]|nr:hypothetical protein Q9Q99_06510 [Curtobacterium flaccumfaciens]